MPLELLDSPCAVPPFVGCFIKGSLCGLILYCRVQNLLQPTLRNSGPCHYYYYSHCGRALSIYLRPCQIYYTSAARKKSSAARTQSLQRAAVLIALSVIRCSAAGALFLGLNHSTSSFFVYFMTCSFMCRAGKNAFSLSR